MTKRWDENQELLDSIKNILGTMHKRWLEDPELWDAIRDSLGVMYDTIPVEEKPISPVLTVTIDSITPSNPEVGEAFEVGVTVSETAGASTEGLSVNLVVDGTDISESFTLTELNNSSDTVIFSGLSVDTSGSYTVAVTADANNTESVTDQTDFIVEEKEPETAVLEIVDIDIVPAEPEVGESFTLDVEVSETSGVQTDGLSVGLVIDGTEIDQTFTPDQLNGTTTTVSFNGLVIESVGSYTAIVTAGAVNAQTVSTKQVFTVTDVEEPKPGVGEEIPVDQTQLHEYPDPTTLERYQEYPVDPIKPYVLEKPLADIAAEMQPGEWRRITDAPYWTTTAWGDKAMWDSSRQRLSWVGAHGIPRPTRWAMLDFKNSEMRRQTGDKFHPYAGIHAEWGHRSYGFYTQLADGSNVYARFSRLWKQDPETLEWSAWAMIPDFQNIGGGIEYFPEMGRQGSIIHHAAISTSVDATRFMAYDVATGKWRTLPKPAVQGRHSLMRYNPVRKEVLLLGGDQSYRTAQTLHPDGTLTRMADSPRNMRIMLDQLCVDPVSGHYLVMSSEKDDSREHYAEFFGFNAADNRWYVIDQWADRKAQDAETTIKHEWAACAAIPEFGVTIWPATARNSVSLYKHKVPA